MVDRYEAVYRQLISGRRGHATRERLSLVPLAMTRRPVADAAV
jgi:hypothetical protein